MGWIEVGRKEGGWVVGWLGGGKREGRVAVRVGGSEKGREGEREGRRKGLMEEESEGNFRGGEGVVASVVDVGVDESPVERIDGGVCREGGEC